MMPCRPPKSTLFPYTTLFRSLLDIRVPHPHSHSIVAGGLDVTSYSSRLTPCTSLTTRLRSEEHTSELQSQSNLVCRLLLEKKKLYATWPTSSVRSASARTRCC